MSINMVAAIAFIAASYNDFEAESIRLSAKRWNAGVYVKEFSRGYQ
ncbi:MAG: hypothetical protein AB3A66_22945 [Nodularia sp. CChRGM 3473]